LKPVNKSSRYRSFIRGRNKALEKVLTLYQLRVSDELRRLFSEVLGMVQTTYSRLDNPDHFDWSHKKAIDELNKKISGVFDMGVFTLSRLAQTLRRRTYVLSYAGEVEGLSRAIGKPQRRSLTADDLDELFSDKSAGGGQLEARISVILDKLKNNVLDAVRRAALRGDSLEDALKSVYRVLPKSRAMSVPRKHLKDPKIEADKPFTVFDLELKKKGYTASTGFVDPQEWEALTQDYLEEFIPKWRNPETEFSIRVPKTDERITTYGWELEKEITEDFVYQVRQGTVDAAKENGITDFVWIAIVDDKTCEHCCLWRDGLTTTEIERKLKSERSGDECQAITPPAHFNCRCDIAPLTKDMPEAEPINYGEFDRWLNDTTISQSTL